MDSFETVVAQILEQDGHWVRRSVKVNLTREEKVEIGRPSTPRWEIDLVAYRPKTNTILAVECKSYLDSPGIDLASFEEQNLGSKSNLKLFVEPKLREVVFNRLAVEMEGAGLCRKAPTVKLGLATGHIKRQSEREAIHQLFRANNWKLYDESWFVQGLRSLAQVGYEDLVPTIVAKLILRGSEAGAELSS